METLLVLRFEFITRPSYSDLARSRNCSGEILNQRVGVAPHLFPLTPAPTPARAHAHALLRAIQLAQLLPSMHRYICDNPLD